MPRFSTQPVLRGVKYEHEAELTRVDGAAAASGSSALEMSHAGTSSGPPVFGANQ